MTRIDSADLPMGDVMNINSRRTVDGAVCRTVGQRPGHVLSKIGRAALVASALAASTLGAPAAAEPLQWPNPILLQGSPNIGYDVFTQTPLYVGTEFHWGSDAYHWRLRSTTDPGAPPWWAEFTYGGPGIFTATLDVTLKVKPANAGLGIGIVHLFAGNEDGIVWSGWVAPSLEVRVPQLGIDKTVTGGYTTGGHARETVSTSFDAGGLTNVHVLLDYSVFGGCYNVPGICAYVPASPFSLGAVLVPAAAVPEPQTFATLAVGLALLAVLGLRARSLPSSAAQAPSRTQST